MFLSIRNSINIYILYIYVNTHIIHFSYLLFPSGHHFIVCHKIFFMHTCKLHLFLFLFILRTTLAKECIPGWNLPILCKSVFQPKNLGRGLSIHENLNSKNMSGPLGLSCLEKQIPSICWRIKNQEVRRTHHQRLLGRKWDTDLALPTPTPPPSRP